MNDKNEEAIWVDEHGFVHIRVEDGHLPSSATTFCDAEPAPKTFNTHSVNPMHIGVVTLIGRYTDLVIVTSRDGSTVTLRETSYEKVMECWALAKQRWVGAATDG